MSGPELSLTSFEVSIAADVSVAVGKQTLKAQSERMGTMKQATWMQRPTLRAASLWAG